MSKDHARLNTHYFAPRSREQQLPILAKLWGKAATLCRRFFGVAVLLAATFHFSAHPAAAQSGKDTIVVSTQNANVLIGTVVDVVGRPMANVEVYIAGTTRSTRTDQQGVWRISEPPPGPRVMVAREVGYVPYVREIQVSTGVKDSVSLLLRRFPNTLTRVQITARSNLATADANMIAERLAQMRVGSGRLFTREQIVQMRPYSLAEMLFGIPGISIQRGQNDIVITSTRSGVGVLNVAGQQCQLQVFLDNTPIDNESLGALDPLMFRSVEVYPQTLQLTGLSMHPDRCGAVVINTMRR